MLMEFHDPWSAPNQSNPRTGGQSGRHRSPSLSPSSVFIFLTHTAHVCLRSTRNDPYKHDHYIRLRCWAWHCFKGFFLLSLISCQSAAMACFVCTDLLSSTLDTELSLGKGPQHSDYAEPVRLLDSIWRK